MQSSTSTSRPREPLSSHGDVAGDHHHHRRYGHRRVWRRLGPRPIDRSERADGIVVDASGAVYIADTGNDRIRKVTLDGIISTIAEATGKDSPATEDWPLEPGWATQRDWPGLCGHLYIADARNYRVRKVNPEGVISTFAGNGIGDSAGTKGRPVSRC